MVHITFIGDSITQGNFVTAPPYNVLPTQTFSYRTLVRLEPSSAITVGDISPWSGAGTPATNKQYTGTNYTVYNAGIGGHRTDQILARWDIDVLGHPNDFCVIMAGVNDLANGVTAQTACDNISLMIDSCKANGIIPILCKLTPWTRGTTQNKDDADVFNGLLTTLAGTHNVEIVDTFTPLRDGSTRNLKPSYDADGIHLTPAGYQAVAEAFNLTSFDNVYDLDVNLVRFGEYQLTYNANGGTGTIAPTNGINVTAATTGFARAGYNLTGWNTAADGSGTAYALGATVVMTADMTLYAVWVQSITRRRTNLIQGGY